MEINMNGRILLVDDDVLVCKSLTPVLRRAGYLTVLANCAEEAFAVFDRRRLDLILLDIGLPGIDGYECLRRIRKHSNIPVIFITGRQRSVDEVIGLDLGADDYIIKPFETDVLIARLNAVLRRYQHGQQNEIVVGKLRIDLAARAVCLGKDEISLPPKQFGILKALAENAGQVMSAEDLVACVWGSDWIGETQTIYVHIRWLREKMEKDPAHPQFVLTVNGAGYKLSPTALTMQAFA